MYFIKKKAVLDTYFEIAPFHYNLGKVWFFSHKYTWNTMNITYAN